MTRVTARLLRIACALPLYALAALALAGTNVGGPITVDTAWNLAGAPYTATSDVTVDSGATLTIEPGVTVFMNPGTSLVIKSGALVAQGTSATPIVVTSARDVPNPNPLPAPGDWGQLKFQSGTVAASTVLDYVQVKYGSGISLTGASPTLNRVSSLNHLGAAFAIDLASSPAGQGLVATGNTLNGISVPAGDIVGDVKWGLIGVPYVVTQGVVGVGVPPVLPTIGVPASLLVAPGNVATLPITLSAPAPANGLSVTLQSANTAVATVGSPVNIAAGASTANASVTGMALGTTTVTASAVGYTPGTASITVAAIALDIQPPGPITVPLGVSQSYQLKLSQAAPAGGVTVTLGDNGPGTSTSPSSVTIAQGQTLSAAFSVRGMQVGPTTITLSSPGLTSKAINVDVLGQGTLVFNKTSAPIGKMMQTAPNDFTVQLRAGGVPFNAPAPVTIDLSSGDPSKATVPATVTIAAGANTAGFTIAGVELAATPFNIDAAATSGYTSPAAKISTTVVAPQFVFSLLDGARVTTAGIRDDFTLKLVVPGDPGSQTATAAIPASMSITDQAPPGIVDGVYTAASGGVIASQLVIPAGGTSVTGYVGLPTVAGTYTVTASIAGLTSTTSGVQTVTSPALQLASGYFISAGLTSQLQVTRSGSLASPVTVTLTCTPSAFCSVPSSVVIPASAASTSFAMTGVAVGLGTLTASSAGYASASSPVNVATPSFRVSANLISTPIGGTISLGISLGVGGEVAPTDVVLSLVSNSPGVASIPATVTIPAGSTGVGNIPLVGLAPGTATVTMSSLGFTPVTTGAFTVIDNRLQLAPTGATVGVGGTLPMTVSIANPSLTSNVPVTLTSSNSAFVSVPPSVTIPQFATSANVNATGVAAGPSTITAHATGYIDATATITAGSLALSLPSDTLVAPGNTRTLTLTLSAPAPAGGLVVNLASQFPTVVSVPPTVTFAANATTATFDVTSLVWGISNVTASAPGATSAVCRVLSSPVTLELVPDTVDITIPEGVSQGWQVRWALQPAYQSLGLSPNKDLAIDVASADPATASASPASITIPAGQANAPVTIMGVAKGATTFTLSSPGLSNPDYGVNVLDPGSLAFPTGAATLGKGMIAQAVIQLSAGGNPYAGQVPVTIALVNSDPTKVTVPATATVPANSSFALIPLTGLDLTATATIGASTTTGYAPTQFPVSVVPPLLQFYSLDGTRIVAGGRDQFFVDIARPAGSNLSQWLINPVTIALSITNASPAGIVGAFHDQASGGTTITQLTFPAGPQNSLTVKGFVGQPTLAGTYQVTGTVASLVTGTSAVQTVSATGTLEFFTPDLVVGKGLRHNFVAVSRKVNGQPFRPDDPLVVTLTNSDPTRVSLPASVTIPAKQDTVLFAVTGVDLTTIPVIVDATATGYDAPVAKMNVSVVTPQLQIYGLDTVRTIDSARDDFYVYWYVPGTFISQVSAVDIDVLLSITDQSPAGIVPGITDGGAAITKVTIPADQNGSPSVSYIDVPAVALGSYTVTATAPGLALTVSPVQTVTNATPVVGIFIGNDIVLGAGMQTPDDFSILVSRTIQGYPFYGASPVDVTLTLDQPDAVLLPPLVTIDGAQAEVPIRMTGNFNGNWNLTFSAPGYLPATPRTLAVVPPQLEFQFNDPTLTVGVDGLVQFYVNAVVPNGYPFNQTVYVDPITFSITSSNPAVGIINTPSQLILPGQYQAFSEAMGIAPGTFTIRVEPLSGNVLFGTVVSEPITVTP